MSKDAVAAGNEFGIIVIDAMQRVGLPAEGRLAFYCTEIGVQLGNIAGDVGKDATLSMIDVIRATIANLPDRSKELH